MEGWIHVGTDGWRAVVDALFDSEDAEWEFVESTTEQRLLVHGIPTLMCRTVRWTVDGRPLEECTRYTTRMVGNGTLLEDQSAHEVDFESSDGPVRIVAIDGQSGYFVRPDTPAVRTLLARWKPTSRPLPTERAPWPPQEDPAEPPRVYTERASDVLPSVPHYEEGPVRAGPFWRCPLGHIHDSCERDPINDAFFCIECGREIVD